MAPAAVFQVSLKWYLVITARLMGALQRAVPAVHTGGWLSLPDWGPLTTCTIPSWCLHSFCLGKEATCHICTVLLSSSAGLGDISGRHSFPLLLGGFVILGSVPSLFPCSPRWPSCSWGGFIYNGFPPINRLPNRSRGDSISPVEGGGSGLWSERPVSVGPEMSPDGRIWNT